MTIGAENKVMFALGLGVIAYALVAARLGFFIIDEVIYVFAAETFSATGGFTLENGLHLAASGDLFLSNLLTHGPNGITSQYPPGTAVLWAPLIEWFGIRGIVTFNAVCLVGSVFATHALARHMTQDSGIALGASVLFLFGTFALEYGYVIWPHTVSVLTVTGALLFLLRALDARGDVFRQAVASGLILGLGVLFHLSNILALPAFGALTLLFAPRILPVLTGGAVGMAPALIFLAFANLTKFNSANPLSYGAKENGGSTNLSAYVPFALVLLAIMAVLFFIRTRKGGDWRLWGSLAVVGAVGAFVAMPEIQRLMVRIADGFVRLVVDARTIPSSFSGVTDMPDGTRSFWGLSKKALGQSAPWLGMLVLLLLPRFRKGQGRAVAVALIVSALFMLPFLIRNWHGGMSSNMRYFLPVLPLMSVMGAMLFRELLALADVPTSRLWSAIGLGVVSSFAWMMVMPSALAGAHQIWALYAFGAISAVALICVLMPKVAVARAMVLVAGMGVGVSVFNTATDTIVSQMRRAANEVLTDLSIGYDGKALIYGRMLRSAMASPDQMVAAPQIGGTMPDGDLVGLALRQGYRVLMPEDLARVFAEGHPGYRWQAAQGPADLVEVIAPGR